MKTTHRRSTVPDDDGFSLLEVMIGMTIMGTFLAIFGGAMVSMFRSADRTQSTAFAQSSRNQVYVRLDREIRYASGISSPGVDQAGNPSVEWANTYGTQQICTQLRITAGTLQTRSWVQPDDTSAAISMDKTVIVGTGVRAATPLATPSVAPKTDVVVSGPFATIAATGDSSNQRLEIAVTAYEEENPDATSNTRPRSLDLTFTALNTGTSTSSTSVCSAGRRTAWPSP